MKSNKAVLLFIVQSSGLSLPQKNHLAARLFDLSENDTKQLCRKIELKKDNEGVAREIALYFGLTDLIFGEEKKITTK